MIGVGIRAWHAWSPGREEREAWRAWCARPQPLDAEGQPDASFLPALLRRRCGPLARAMLHAAFGCCGESERAGLATVFASRHGNINESIGLLERLARDQALSPTRFSHTVHNAQAGLFSIAAENRQASSSMAACEETFGCAWLEALTLLQREPGRPVLLVVGDALLAPTFSVLVDEPPAFYALALLLEARAQGPSLHFSLAPGGAAPDRHWPDALEFLRGYLGEQSRWELVTRRRRWVWERR